MIGKNPETTRRRVKVNPLVEESIRRAAAMLASGKTMEQAAKAVARKPETLHGWQKTHPDLWKAVE